VTSIGFADPGCLRLLYPLAILIAAGFSLKWYLSLRFEEFFKGDNVSVPGLSSRRSWVKGSVLSVVFGSMVLASGDPFVGTSVRVHSIMAVVDISQSMWSEDYHEKGGSRSRLETAKKHLLSLLDELPSESRFGLGVFAGRSDPLMILTPPQHVGKSRADLKTMIESIHYHWTWEDGSNIRQTLSHFGKIFKENEDLYGQGLTVAVLTDGEELSGYLVGQTELEIDHLQNIRFFLAGYGTANGAPVPEFDKNWKFSQYRQSYDGTVLVSRLDEGNLSDLAGKLNGVYKHIEDDSTLVEMLIKEGGRSAVYENRVDVSWAFWLGSLVLLVSSLLI